MSSPNQNESESNPSKGTFNSDPSHIVALPDISSNPDPSSNLELNGPHPLESPSAAMESEKGNPMEEVSIGKMNDKAQVGEKKEKGVDADGDQNMVEVNNSESPITGSGHTKIDHQSNDSSTQTSPSFASSSRTKACPAAEPSSAGESSSSSSSDIKMEEEETWELRVNWSGKESFDLKVMASDRVYDLKALIYSLTSVAVDRQKIIGLTKGKMPSDETIFADLKIPKKHRFTLIGTPEDQTFKDPAKMSAALGQMPDAMDDFDISYDTANGPLKTPADDPRNQRNIMKKIAECPISIMNAPRPGKKLLVLDLDYTLVDTKPLLAQSLPPMECVRPGLHDFLEKVYPYYDIVVWSQTSIWWLETKLFELGMIGDPSRTYKLLCVADRTSMFSVFGKKGGKTYKHEVKPLAYFWKQPDFKQWGKQNTVHIDDLSRNFALNPGEGLKIRAFHGAGTPDGARDHQLIKLTDYLVRIAQCDDFTTLDHTNWKKPPA